MSGAQLVSRASDVRITEINLSQVILNSSSSIAMIPIISTQGSTQPKFFSNSNDFQFEYGTPNPSVSNSIQSALNFFTEGNQLWALRVAGTGARVSSILMYTDNTGLTKFRTYGLAAPWDIDPSTLVTGTEVAIALFYSSRGPGSYANNYSLSIQDNGVSAPATVGATSANSGGTLSSATYVYKVSALSASGESLGSSTATVVVSGLSMPTAANTITWSPVPNAIGYRIYGRVSGAANGYIAQVGGATYSFTDTGGITPDNTRHPITDPTLAASSSAFVVSIWDNTQPYSSALETWTCTLTPNVDSSGVQTELEDRINPFSQYINVRSNVAALITVPVVTAVTTTAFSGGDSGSAPTSSQVALALQVFTNKQLYNTNIFINAGMSDPVMQLALDTLVQARGDAVALLDVPSSSQNTQSAVDYRNLTLNLNSSYSALFAPDLLQADLYNGKQIYIPPSGWAAALCARTDKVANPAYSIAGLNRGLLNVLKARYQYDDGQATQLYNAQVNYTRTFVGQGIALWEQRTLAANFSALSWLNVRRELNVIKTSMYAYLLYALQEMDTDTVRRQLVNATNNYLQALMAADAINSGEAFCDNRNNNAQTYNAGVLVFTVIIIPSIAIHEVQLQLAVSRQGISFSEVLSQVS